MRKNRHTNIWGKNVILVPYKAEHVPKYVLAYFTYSCTLMQCLSRVKGLSINSYVSPTPINKKRRINSSVLVMLFYADSVLLTSNVATRSVMRKWSACS
jgi:hypothetical protein